jgi:hypothetical protein
LTAISVVLMAIQENSENPGTWSSLWVVATVFCLYYCGSAMTVKQLGLHIYHNPIETVVYFLLYTGVGLIWSFYKWKEIVSDALVVYNEKVSSFNEYPKTYSKPNPEKYRPQLNENKAKIFNWIFYWPFSITWFLIHEPIERLFKWIMKNTKKIYEGITDRAFAKAEVIKTQDDMVHK